MKKRALCFLILVMLYISLGAVSALAEEDSLLLAEEDSLLLAEEGSLLLEGVPASPMTIRAVTALPADTPGVVFRGCVVWADAEGIIVQDDTGSIPLSVSEAFQPGDMVLVTGRTGQEAFIPEEMTVEGTGPLPAAERDSLTDLPEGLRVLIRGGTLSAGILTKDGYSMEVQAGEIPEGTADVYGIRFGDILYVDSFLPIPKPDREWKAWFGLLDAHTNLSDGQGTVQEAFSYASQVEGLDFFAVTDHSDSLDNALSGEITRDGTAVSAKWAAGKNAAAALTSQHFVGIFGYEMSWAEDHKPGHINTFATPGWQTPRQSGMDTLAGYCAALAKVPGSVSQFNHPGLAYGEFNNFRPYDPACDTCIQLLQVEGEGGESFYDYFLRALDAGWHVAPTVGQDNHHGNWGSAGASRTGVLAKSLSEDALYEAMACRRVYATQDSDLYIDYRLNGNLMGSVMGLTEGLEASVLLDDPTDVGKYTVEVIGTGGIVLASGETAGGTLSLSVPDGWPYYFLRVTQSDGDVAVTAPVWVDDYQDMGIGEFTADADSLLTGQAVNLTLTLYNREMIPFEVTAVELYHGQQRLGSFTSSGSLRYTYPLLWESPGEVRLTAVVLGMADGAERSYEADITLHFGVPDPVKAAIRQARVGNPGTVYTVEGYATSGNTNPWTTFPDTIYVQDDTGGIPVMGNFTQKIQVGTPLTITGVLRDRDGERYLELTDCQLPQKPLYRYVSPTLGCQEATDYSSRGGSLVQTEGIVTAVTPTADGKGIARFTLRDSRWDTAQVVIDPEIRSGAYGVNDLAQRIRENKTVRVIGLLTMEATGQAALRVRNCDEVVTVAPVPKPAAAAVIADESNPRTGDRWIWFQIADFCGKRLH